MIWPATTPTPRGFSKLPETKTEAVHATHSQITTSRPHPILRLAEERAHSEEPPIYPAQMQNLKPPKDLRKKKSRGGGNKKKNLRETSDGEEVEKVWATKKR